MGRWGEEAMGRGGDGARRRWGEEARRRGGDGARRRWGEEAMGRWGEDTAPSRPRLIATL